MKKRIIFGGNIYFSINNLPIRVIECLPILVKNSKYHQFFFNSFINHLNSK
jgi:hypothetical protein